MTGERYITVEMMSAGIAIVWGAMVANPLVDTFSRFPKLYAPMTEIVPYEMFWGLLFIAAGIAAVWVRFRRESQQKSALIMAVVFVFFSVLFAIGDPQSQAWGVYGLIGVCNAIHYQGFKWKTKHSSNR